MDEKKVLFFNKKNYNRLQIAVVQEESHILRSSQL